MIKIVSAGMLSTLVLLSSCLGTAPGISYNKSFHLAIELNRAEYCNIKEVRGKATLTNVSDESILVYKRLLFSPVQYVFPYSPGYLSLKDPSGDLIQPSMRIDEIRAEEDDFILILPGTKIEADIDIYRSFAYHDYYFRRAGVYKLIAVYQNNLHVEKIVDGKKVVSWVGEITSNEVPFQIDSKNCQ